MIKCNTPIQETLIEYGGLVEGGARGARITGLFERYAKTKCYIGNPRGSRNNGCWCCWRCILIAVVVVDDDMDIIGDCCGGGGGEKVRILSAALFVTATTTTGSVGEGKRL